MSNNYQLQNDILTFPALSAHKNIIHGVTTRNFHDDPFDKIAVLEKIVKVLEIKPRLIVTCKQTHEANVAEIKSKDFPNQEIIELDKKNVAQAPSPVRFVEIDNTDAIVTAEPGVLLAVVSADCVPLFLADPIGGQIGVVHAGWRGTYGRIVRNAMRAMQSAGAKPFRSIAHTGPCISQQNYEVSPELIEQFRARFPDCGAAFESRHLDLELLNLHQLRQSGLKLDNIELASQCTFANPDRFASYRRDGKNAGRLYSFMMIREK